MGERGALEGRTVAEIRAAHADPLGTGRRADAARIAGVARHPVASVADIASVWRAARSARAERVRTNDAVLKKREARGGFRRVVMTRSTSRGCPRARRRPAASHSERARRRAIDDRREGQTREMQYGGQNGGFGQQGDREKQRYIMMDARKSYTNSWATDLMSAPCTNPGFCLYAACWCVSVFAPLDPVRTRDLVRARPPSRPPPRPRPPDLPPTAFFFKHGVRTRCLIIPHPSSRRLSPLRPPRLILPPLRIATATCAWRTASARSSCSTTSPTTRAATATFASPAAWARSPAPSFACASRRFAASPPPSPPTVS